MVIGIIPLRRGEPRAMISSAAKRTLSCFDSAVPIDARVEAVIVASPSELNCVSGRLLFATPLGVTGDAGRASVRCAVGGCGNALRAEPETELAEDNVLGARLTVLLRDDERDGEMLEQPLSDTAPSAPDHPCICCVGKNGEEAGVCT